MSNCARLKKGVITLLTFFKTEAGRLVKTDTLLPGGWASAVEPTDKEIDFLLGELGLDSGFVRSSLDAEESPRIEVEDEQTFIITDVPIAEQNEEAVFYSTLPVGIILHGDNIITICSKSNNVITDCEEGHMRNANTGARIRFALSLMMRATGYFHQYLRNIDKISTDIQNRLHHSMKNRELIQMMELTKSLVYFTTSLRSNELTLEKLMRGRTVKLMEEDEDLLDDVLIEMKQAIDMSVIYKDILSGMMDAFASIISNNLNVVMKVLAAVTIVLTIPSVISGFYGMNVEGIPMPTFWTPVGLALGGVCIALIILNKYDLLS